MEIDEIKDFTTSLGTLDILARGMSRNDLLLMLHFPNAQGGFKIFDMLPTYLVLVHGGCTLHFKVRLYS
eukprot:scaffold3319_cov56-Phaeocystis_antarctica.AAC.4